MGPSSQLASKIVAREYSYRLSGRARWIERRRSGNYREGMRQDGTPILEPSSA